MVSVGNLVTLKANVRWRAKHCLPTIFEAEVHFLYVTFMAQLIQITDEFWDNIRTTFKDRV